MILLTSTGMGEAKDHGLIIGIVKRNLVVDSEGGNSFTKVEKVLGYFNNQYHGMRQKTAYT